MTNGYAWIVGEFALIGKRERILIQQTVSGYSKIEPMNSDIQKEILYEHAVNHARSKFLYDNHKPSDENVDFAIIEYGFKKTYKGKDGFNITKSTKLKLKKSARNRAEQRVLIQADEKREDKSKMVTERDKQKMYKEPKGSRVKRITQEFSALTPKEKKELIKILSKK